jgi:small-conductance mechanosensitive channel
MMPLIRRFFQITIVVISMMIMLSSLGINIGPLIAGAGVVGLAVGFGAQTLVTDVISGLFYLIDDAFRTGEYVDIGVVKGRVEKMNVRSLVLRHHRGALNTVPYSEIKHLKNYSRDWVIMKLVFWVTCDTDVNQVKKTFKKIGQDLLADPVLGPGFIEPFKSQGVLSMEDSAMIVRGKFMAKPGEQFMIRKEIYSRVQKAFDEDGIKFAHRRVLVDMAETDSEQDREDVAGAAAAAAAPAAAATSD